MDHQSYYDQLKKKLTENRSALDANKQSLNSLLAEIGEMRERLTKLEQEYKKTEQNITLLQLANIDFPQKERSVMIRWPLFLEYVAENKDAWRYKGKGKAIDHRWFCKAPDCTTGGKRKIVDWEVIGKYELITISHGIWRLCHDCVPFAHCRRGALTRARSPGSTRPIIDSSSIITLDPYIFGTLKVVEDLLKLSGTVINYGQASLLQEEPATKDQ